MLRVLFLHFSMQTKHVLIPLKDIHTHPPPVYWMRERFENRTLNGLQKNIFRGWEPLGPSYKDFTCKFYAMLIF